MEFNIDWGAYGLIKLVSDYEFDTVLDIGSGDGEHKRFLEYMGKCVKSVDFDKEADYSGDFMEMDFPEKFDAIWCSHVMEHQRNVGAFLEKIYSVLKDDGVLAVVVPNHTPDRLVAGHVTAWGVPLICYNLILAGFDCREAKILSSNYELSLVVKKKKADIDIRFKNSIIGDDKENPFSSLDEYFPFEAIQGRGFAGEGNINWGTVQPSIPREYMINSKNCNFQIRPI